MNHFTPLKQELEKYLDEDQIDDIHRAYLVAEKAHQGQKRRSGEDYITHPVAAAILLADIRMDYQSIMATLLHDVIEDTAISKEALIEEFGADIAELVDGVSKLNQIEFASRAEAQAESFRKMVLAMVRDIRVILVKLADRLHNMRTLGSMPAEKRRRIANETLEIYAPIANRLGMHNFYTEFEDLGFKQLYPMRARILEDSVAKARGNRKEIIKTIEKSLTQSFQEKDIDAKAVFGRQKHLYSIYKKMRSKSASFSEIMDVYAFRVIVKSIDDCYRALGVVHRLYKPVPERFKDYIAIPKANGYQSLHTSLFGPYGVPIEIQIRTEEMDHIAENGIAAHWLYKSSGLEASDAQVRAREWVKGLLEMQESTGNSIEFIENVKFDLFPDEVYVFTPQGEIIELPKGATPVDFAYAIHSDIGNTCIAVRINRRLAPLSTVLSNGQSVEVVTASGASPNPSWLNFVVTGKARSNIRHFLKSQQKAESIELGKRLLNISLEDFNSSLDNLTDDETQNIVEELHYKDFEELCEAVGLGNELAQVIAQRFLNVLGDEQYDKTAVAGADQEHPLAIKGTEGIVVTFSECCRPIPGDPIVGVLTKGKGILVHVEDCEKISKLRKHPELLIVMIWEDDVVGDFEVELEIGVINQRGVLAQLASAIADAESNIDNISVEQRNGEHSCVKITLMVHNRVHLARVMRRMKAMKVVTRLARIRAN